MPERISKFKRLIKGKFGKTIEYIPSADPLQGLIELNQECEENRIVENAI